MPLTSVGAAALTSLMAGSGTPFNNANTLLGVGNGTTAFNAFQIDLQGASKALKAMDIGYPIINGNIMTVQATFTGTDANFAWNEWAVFDTDGKMLSRLVESHGIKNVGETWIFQATLTLST